MSQQCRCEVHGPAGSQRSCSDLQREENKTQLQVTHSGLTGSLNTQDHLNVPINCNKLERKVVFVINRLHGLIHGHLNYYSSLEKHYIHRFAYIQKQTWCNIAKNPPLHVKVSCIIQECVYVWTIDKPS